MPITTATAEIYDEIQRLRETADPEATKRLVQIMQEDAHAPARAEAAKAIGAIHGMDSARPLAKLLQSPNPQARILAAEALGELDSAGAVEPLVAALQDENEVVRANAAAGLGKVGNDHAIAPLIPALADKSLEVQFAAAGSLADLGKPSAIEPLIAWSGRVFAAQIKEFNAHQKATMIHAIMVNLLERLDDDQIYLLSSHIGQKVEIKTWGLLHTGARDIQCWLQESVDSPIGRAVKEELALRRAEGGGKNTTTAPEAEASDQSALDQPATVELSLDEIAKHEAEWLSDMGVNGPPGGVAPSASSPAAEPNGPSAFDIISSLAQGTFQGLEPPPPMAATEPAAPPIAEEPAAQAAPEEAEGPVTEQELMTVSMSEIESNPNPEPAQSADLDQAVPTSAEPAPESAAPEAVAPAPPAEVAVPEIPMPQPAGVVADFLSMLEANHLDLVVLIGGAVRDLALGRQPDDLDVTIELKLWEEMKKHGRDALAWNTQFAEQAAVQLELLARALGVGVEELIDGKASFSANGVSIPVHYVGPFLIEESETSYDRRFVGRVRREKASRLGLVVDQASKQVHGLVPISTIDSLCMDCLGHGLGDPRGMHHLNERILHVDPPARRLGVGDVIRTLTAKHGLGAELSESAAEMLFAAAEAVSTRSEEAKKDFYSAEFARLVDAGGMESVVEDLDMLGLAESFMPWLEKSQQKKVREILSRRAKESEERLAGVKGEFEAAEGDLQEKSRAFEAKSEGFTESAGSLDAARVAVEELAARRRDALGRLAEAERAAEETRKTLDAATARFRATTASGKADVATIREHREALAAERNLEAEVAKIKAEVKTAEEELEANRSKVFELQDGLGRIGEELEAAVTARDEAQARHDGAQAALAQLQAEMELTPERRRAQIRRRPAAASAA